MTAPARSVPILVPRAGLRDVVESDRRRVPIGGWILVASVLFAAFLGMIWSRTALDHNAFDIQEIEYQIEIEEARYWELRLEAARLQDPARITTLAEEMGMVYPDQVRTIVVSGVGGPGADAEDRWAELKGLLSASP